MPVLTTAPRDRASLAAALTDPARVLVVSLCADWCDTCREFRSAFESIASTRPHASFVWIDIEDDSTIAGDIDIENFPTLAIYRGDMVLHFGISLPQQATVARLVDAMIERRDASADVPQGVAALPQSLRTNALAKT